MKPSSFNPERQNEKIESKIVVALERVSEAFRVLLWNESKEHGLSPIQIQLLIFLLFHTKDKCKVSYLAREFNMTKPTISDSVKVLLAKELVIKESDPVDTRSYMLSLTSSGKEIAEKAASFSSVLEKPIAKLTASQKSDVYQSLTQLIVELNSSGVVTLQRNCFNCRYHRRDDQGHYCNLLNMRLKSNDIRVDCPEFEVQ